MHTTVKWQLGSSLLLLHICAQSNWINFYWYKPTSGLLITNPALWSATHHKSCLMIGYSSQNLPYDWLLITNPALWLATNHKSCLMIGWALTVYIGDRPLVAKGIIFQIQNNGRKLTFYRCFSSFLWNNILSD